MQAAAASLHWILFTLSCAMGLLSLSRGLEYHLYGHVFWLISLTLRREYYHIFLVILVDFQSYWQCRYAQCGCEPQIKTLNSLLFLLILKRPPKSQQKSACKINLLKKMWRKARTNERFKNCKEQGPLLILEHDEKSTLIVGSEERIDGKKIELTSINHLFRTFRSHRKVIKTRRWILGWYLSIWEELMELMPGKKGRNWRYWKGKENTDGYTGIERECHPVSRQHGGSAEACPLLLWEAWQGHVQCLWVGL